MNFLAKLLARIVRGVSLATNAAAELPIGMIGLDTSHVAAFTALLNDPKSPNRVWCESEPGKGATFVVQFPAT